MTIKSRPLRLCALFVDFDNVYLGLQRHNPVAATRFAMDAGHWLEAFERGSIITWAKPGAKPGAKPDSKSATKPDKKPERRLVVARAYGNPDGTRDDASGFAQVRNQFVRAGIEIIDCPPLTNQLKNSADIRMVMDIRDYLDHKPAIDEFIILSGDADFVPVLYRLRAHARQSVIFASERTAVSYSALCDGTVTDVNLIDYLMEGRLPAGNETNDQLALEGICALRQEIIDEAAKLIDASPDKLPLEQLATRLRTILGKKRTTDAKWGGYGQFRALLMAHLPARYCVTDHAPFFALDRERHIPMQLPPLPVPDQSDKRPTRNNKADNTGGRTGPLSSADPAQLAALNERLAALMTHAERPATLPPLPVQPEERSTDQSETQQPATGPIAAEPGPQAPASTTQDDTATQDNKLTDTDNDTATRTADQPHPAARAETTGSAPEALRNIITEILSVSKIPPLPAPEYHKIFGFLALELAEAGFRFTSTAENTAHRAKAAGVSLNPTAIQFVLDAIRRTGHWLDRTDSADLLARKFRDYVLAQCFNAGLELGSSELDLLDAWFIADPLPAPQQGLADHIRQQNITTGQSLPGSSPKSSPDAATG